MRAASNRVVYTRPAGRGWATVELLAHLLAELTDAQLVEVSDQDRLRERVRRVGGLLPRSRRGSAWCVVVAPAPVHLSAVVGRRHLTTGFARVAGWVVDSFWDDRIPFVARGRGHFDHLFVTDRELVGSWERQTGTTTTWLPFGADVLRRGSDSPERPVDVLRVGRQPEDWEDDERTAARARAHDVVFAGRPTLLPDAIDNQESLLGAMRSAKLTVSFTNLASPASYTHPTRDYLTGRWTDALACGCIVAGIPPAAEAATLLLWPQGLLVLDGTDLEPGLARMAEALEAWSPEVPHLNYRRSLRRLDWRWRFQELLTTLEVPVPDRLEHEIDEIETILRR